MTVTYYHPHTKSTTFICTKKPLFDMKYPIKPRISSIFMNNFFIKSFVIYERMKTFVPAINRSFT